MKEIVEGLVKRLEVEISGTPTGELRNLLCDTNIIIQTLLEDTDVSCDYCTRKKDNMVHICRECINENSVD